MTTREEKGTSGGTGLLRRRARPPEITTPPAGTVLPPHVRTGAPDIPVTTVTPALPPGWEPVGSQGGAQAPARTGAQEQAQEQAQEEARTGAQAEAGAQE